MTVELRSIAPDEFFAFNQATLRAFGEQQSAEETEQYKALFDFERSLAAIDAGQIVGTGILLSLELTLPGLTTVPVGGVSWIGVQPTHRRRGILTAIMRRQLQDVRERGEPLAILWASESVIYGRFGFGMASSQLRLEIDPRHGAFLRSPAPSGSLRYLDTEEAAATLPGIFDSYRHHQPGEVRRSPEMWKMHLRDPEHHRNGFSALFLVVHEDENGTADGYLEYRVKDNWELGIPANIMRIGEMVFCTQEAYAALWSFALQMDLMAKIESHGSADEPLRWMLADPRRLRVTNYSDGLWARLVDIPAALSARTYEVSDSLVIAVTDPLCPENDGSYRLEGGPDGAQCVKTSESPDLALEIRDLGAIFLGGVRPSVLYRAGRVEECSPEVLARADALFASQIAPFCQTGF